MKLKKLLKGLDKYKIFGSQDIEVVGICDNSKSVKKGSLFVAVKGDHIDANDFVNEVVQKGATVVVSEKEPDSALIEKISYVKVDDARSALGIIAGNWYSNPSKKLKVIGVTGSDGKTTTTHIIYEILKEAGKNVGLISSIAARIGNISLDTGFHVTNPEALDLQKYLAQMVKDGTRYVVLETTSHGIAQKRVAGINYSIAVLTNITHEHLDYHKTFENYRDTKLKLFLGAKAVVLNKDDESYPLFHKKIKGKEVSYSLKSGADLSAGNIDIKAEIMSFDVVGDKKTYQIVTKLIGRYNVQNVLAAIGAAKLLGIGVKPIQRALANIDRPKGRLEKVKNDKGINIYIDFAHTPNSLKEVLNLLKDQTSGNLIVVFGCASERDAKKRPMMGKIATSIADVSIFTAEDPRREDVGKILKEMEEGIESKNAIYHKIPERGEAISYAIHKLAKAGDTVVICGKAHETSMSYNGVEYPWSDFKAAELALKGKELKIIR